MVPDGSSHSLQTDKYKFSFQFKIEYKVDISNDNLVHSYAKFLLIVVIKIEINYEMSRR